MPIEFKREGNACEKCKKLDSEVGKITHYTDPHDGYEGLLCSECIKKREKPYTEICPICKRVAYEHGGLTYNDDREDFDEWDAKDNDDEDDGYVEADDFNFDNIYDEKPPNFDNLMCIECYEKKLAKAKKIRKTKLTIKNFTKDHWKFWIGTSITIILGIIGLSRL